MYKEKLNKMERLYGGKEKAAKAVGVTVRRWNQMKQFDSVSKPVLKLISILLSERPRQ